MPGLVSYKKQGMKIITGGSFMRSGESIKKAISSGATLEVSMASLPLPVKHAETGKEYLLSSTKKGGLILTAK